MATKMYTYIYVYIFRAGYESSSKAGTTQLTMKFAPFYRVFVQSTFIYQIKFVNER